MTPGEQSKRPGIPALTGLRFLAALSILYAHDIGYFVSDPHSIILKTEAVSNLGMALFFTLSGFVIHYNYRATVSSGWGGRWTFFVARFARLYPLYLACLIADPLLEHGTLAPLATPMLPYFLTLTQSWLGIHAGGNLLAYLLLMGAWSISVEVFLYIAYVPAAPLIARARNTLRILVRWILGFTLLFAVVWLFAYYSEVVSPRGYDWRWMIYVSPYCRLPEFFLGALIAQHVMAAPKPRGSGMALPLAASAVIALPFLAYAYVPLGGVTFMWGFVPGIGALILYLARWRRSVLAIVLGSTAMVALGDASYSLYMLHGYLFEPVGWLQWRTGILSKSTFAPAIAAAALAIIVSLVSYRYFEVPMRRWLRAAMTPRRSVVETDEAIMAGRTGAAAGRID